VFTQTKFGVVFTDFGNYDEINIDYLRKCPSNLLTQPDQAQKCGLAWLKVPTINMENGEKAAVLLKDLTVEKKVVANFVYEDGKRKYCVLAEKGKGDIKQSINFALISKGLAKVDRPLELPYEKEWQEEEDVVSEKKVGIWNTLELEDNDDD